MKLPPSFPRPWIVLALVAASHVAPVGHAQESAPATSRTAPGAVLPDDWAKTLRWRSIGPAGMGGRITAIAVFEADPSTWWVATASGGLVRTTNNGVTFEHQFDRESTVSIGDVAVAQSNKDVVWVGTGEANPRNSASFGDGVYKSTDGGRTWTNMGLRRTFQIGAIVIHPTNPDVVYVAALGRLWGPNEERGLFKTTDGGKTWEKVLYKDERTGAVEVAMNPADPETLIACLWERQRDGFDSHRGDPPVSDGYDAYDPSAKWGPHAGLYKTTDGGRTWKKLGAGLPEGRFGRCDVSWFRKDPRVAFAIVDCDDIGKGPRPSVPYLGIEGEDATEGARVNAVAPKSPAEAAGLRPDDLVAAIGGKPVAAFLDVSVALRDRKPGDAVPISIRRGAETLEIEVRLDSRPISLAGAGPPPTYLGLNGEAVPDGLRVTEVTDGSPADRGGVQVDDVVKALDGEVITTSAQLSELVRVRRPGDKVAIAIVRSGESLDLAVTLGERSARSFGPGAGGGRGFMGAYFGAFVRDREGAEGPEVARIVDDRSAEKAGLRQGDLVLACDGAQVKDAEALVEVLGVRKEGDVANLKVSRDQQVLEIAVTLEAPSSERLRPFGAMYAGQMPNAQEHQGEGGHRYGGVYRTDDAGETWARINSVNPRPMYFSKIRVDPSDDRFVWVLGVSLHRSTNGGKTFTGDGGIGMHADHHALWIDPRDGRHMIGGTDGGFYATWDRGRHWEHLNHLALGQFYHASVDVRRPYRVYGGLQDNGSWGGPARSLAGPGILNEDWISVGGGDGFVCRTDPFDPDVVYTESQDGAMGRRNLKTGESTGISPRPKPGTRHRFNWNTPFILSGHNPGIYYCAGNYVFRSLKRGDDLKPISPEIARTGRGTATALSESPKNADVLWCGTDDGNLWVTKDGGVSWANVADKVGLPGPRWVATIEASRFAEGRCYVAFDGHRSDDDEPHAYATEDFGATWRSLRANLPGGPARCLREDVENQDLLLLGTEFAAWASLDRGRTWTKLNGNLPTVAVHEFAIHPTAGDVVAATHGRSVWVLDASPLRQMTAEAIAAPAWLYEPQAAVRWRSEPSRSTSGGSQRFIASNPRRGAQITYSLTKKAQKASLRVVDYAGTTVRELEARTEPGLHVATWDLTARGRDSAATSAPSRPASRPSAGPGSRPARRGRERVDAPQGPQARGGRAVPLGTYRVILDVDGTEIARPLRVEGDPTLPPDIASTVGRQPEDVNLRDAPPWKDV
jgi:S1-C subfamily serine protease/photosystem II stability/assembly factor-like uncharacterized protein